MRVLSILSIPLFLIPSLVIAQCTGLQIIGFNSDNPDQIFVQATSNIAGNTVYYLTDNEWDGSEFSGGEQRITWTAPSGGVASGSTILLESSSATCGTMGSTTFPILGNGTDEIYITSVDPVGTVPASDICFAVVFGGSGTMPVGKSVDLGTTDNSEYGSGDITNPANWTNSNDPFAFSGSCTLLPVELLYFNVTTSNSFSNLRWSTLSETNNSHFEIEHKTSNSIFRKIGEVAGNGTTLDWNDYSFTHSPSPGINYYRLKQVDFDGTYSYSEVISMDNSSKSKLSLYPTVVTERLTITNLENDGIQQVNFFDISGKKVKEFNLEPGQFNYDFDVSSLPSGHYFLNLKNDHETTTLRFIKH